MITLTRVRRMPRLLVLWIALLVLLAAVAGALAWKVRDSDRNADAGAAALEVAEDYTVELLSYKPSSVDSQLAAASAHLTGQFREDFAKLAKTVVAPAARRDEITTKTEVVAKAVVSASPDRVVALLFVNQTTRSKSSAEPRLSGSRLRVTLQNVDGEWFISELMPL